jgi:hypothetical protein
MGGAIFIASKHQPFFRVLFTAWKIQVSCQKKTILAGAHVLDPLVVEEVLRVPAKSPFKHLILETPLWSYSCSRMSSGANSHLEGLKASECEKGKLGA